MKSNYKLINHKDKTTACSIQIFFYYTVMNLSVLFTLATQSSLCVCDGDLDFNTRLDADAGDLLDDLRRAVKVNEAFVDPHLKPIPGLGTLSTRSLTGGDAQSLKVKKYIYYIHTHTYWITAQN